MIKKQIAVCALGVALLGLSQQCHSQEKRQGNPEKNLPPNITQLTGFGERASWSPDGKRIAFVSKSFGDAFEIDLETRLARLLTGHFLHKGFLRVQYLPNGDFFLIGAFARESDSSSANSENFEVSTPEYLFKNRCLSV